MIPIFTGIAWCIACGLAMPNWKGTVLGLLAPLADVVWLLIILHRDRAHYGSNIEGDVIGGDVVSTVPAIVASCLALAITIVLVRSAQSARASEIDPARGDAD